MYKKDLDIFLQNSIPRSALLYGESDFLIRYYSDKIAQKITPKSNHTIFYYSDYDFKAIMDILSQSSLFGDENLVILKLDKKPEKSKIDEMLKALEHNLSNFLIIEFYQAESRTNTQYFQDCRNLAGSFKNKSNIEVRFFHLNINEAISFLKQRADELGLLIPEQLLSMVLNIQNNNLALAYNELEKLSILNKTITFEDIQRLCYGLGSVDIEELYDCLFIKKDFYDLLDKMQEEGLDEMDLLREMERYFYQLFLFFAYIKTHGSPNAKDILGFSPPAFIVQKLATRAIKIKEEGYLNIFESFKKWRNSALRGEKNQSLQTLIKIQAYIR